LSETAKLELLAYSVALTLKPKLAPAEGDEATAYDAALSLTGGSVAGYWRPARDNFLSRITRDQLLAIIRNRFSLVAGWIPRTPRLRKMTFPRPAGAPECQSRSATLPLSR
jgi:hypothetical protein